jgi:thioredoxin-like negative regulator of GroEL
MGEGMRRTLSFRRTARGVACVAGLVAALGAPWATRRLAAETVAGSAQGARRIPWEASFATALKKAAASRKPLMVDFWAEWCGYCHQLDRTTYADPEVIRLLTDFVSVKVDTEGTPAEAETAMRYQVSSLPTVLFLTPEGRVIFRLSGYQPPPEFAHTLALVRSEGGKVAGWERAVAANPRDGSALMSLGLHLLDNESFEEGRDLLVRAQSAEASLTVADKKRLRLALGALRRMERNFAAAETLYKEGLALKPADGETDPQMLFALGRLYMSWGRREDAVAALKRILADFPASPASDRARRALALLEAQS